jgi:hypothetical protein
MLQRAEVEVGRRVGRRVVVEQVADRREVQALDAGGLGHREVGVVRHPLVDLVAERQRGRARHARRHAGDQRAVAGAGLEQERGAAAAAGLEVEQQADVGELGLRRYPALHAEQADLLAVGEHHHQVAGQRRVAQGPRRLEDRRHARTGVTRTGRVPARVVVAHQHQRRAALASRLARDDVLDEGEDAGRTLAVAVHDRAAIDLDREAERVELRDQMVADPRVRRRADRVRLARDRQLLLVGAGGRERLDRRVGRQRRRRQQAGEAERRAEREGDRVEQGAVEGLGHGPQYARRPRGWRKVRDARRTIDAWTAPWNCMPCTRRHGNTPCRTLRSPSASTN